MTSGQANPEDRCGGVRLHRLRWRPAEQSADEQFESAALTRVAPLSPTRTTRRRLHGCFRRHQADLDGTDKPQTRLAICIGFEGSVAAILLSIVFQRTVVSASDVTGGLSLPWAASSTWLFNGPHAWGGDGLGAWNSLDLEGTDRGNDQVLAAHGGTDYLDGWSTTCGSVRIDEGDELGPPLASSRGRSRR